MKKLAGAMLVVLALGAGVSADSTNAKAVQKSYVADTAVKVGTSVYRKTGKSKLIKVTKKGKRVRFGKIDGRFAIFNDKVYYTKDNILYYAKKNGKGQVKVAKNAGQIIGTSGKTIVTKMGKKLYRIIGKKKSLITKNRYIESAIIYNNSIYAISGEGLYRYRMKNNAKFHRVAARATDMMVQDDMLYYVERTREKNRLIRMDTSEDAEIIAEGAGLRLLDVAKGVVLYAIPGEQDALYLRYENGQTSKLVIENIFEGEDLDSVYCANLYEDKIIIGWYGDGKHSGFSSVNTDGTNPIVLREIYDYTKPEIAGKYLCYGMVTTETATVIYTCITVR